MVRESVFKWLGKLSFLGLWTYLDHKLTMAGSSIFFSWKRVYRGFWLFFKEVKSPNQEHLSSRTLIDCCMLLLGGKDQQYLTVPSKREKERALASIVWPEASCQPCGDPSPWRDLDYPRSLQGRDIVPRLGAFLYKDSRCICLLSPAGLRTWTLLPLSPAPCTPPRWPRGVHGMGTIIPWVKPSQVYWKVWGDWDLIPDLRIVCLSFMCGMAGGVAWRLDPIMPLNELLTVSDHHYCTQYCLC